MIFRQLFDRISCTFTYLLASRKGGEALLIDPVLTQTGHYLTLLEELDLKLVKVIDTHIHADHVSAIGKLRDATRCVTVMGEQSPTDVVAMQVSDNEKLTIDGLTLTALFTPGHTADSYSFLMDDRVFTGDTLLIRGTGRTDLQSGDPYVQYHSLFERLLKLPENTLVFPAHDYKGDMVSTIGEEKAFNPRLNVSSAREYAEIMNNLNLPNLRMMDVAVPKNLRVGLRLMVQRRAPSIEVEDLLETWPDLQVQLIDIRETIERKRHGAIPGAIHMAYGQFTSHCEEAGALRLLAQNTDLLIYCSVGERSTLAVETAQEHGLKNIKHMPGGFRVWKASGGGVETVE